MKSIYLNLVILLALSSPVFAQSARQDYSTALVYIFLGLCAVLVLTQLVPPILLALGISRGVK